MALWFWLWAQLAFAGQVNIVLDNSGSMAWGSTDDRGKGSAPNDPERIAVLGGLVVEGLAKGSGDELGLIVFDSKKIGALQIASFSQLRKDPYGRQTPLKAAISDAATLFKQSQADPKVLLLLTDGSPNDAKTPEELTSLLKGIDVDVIGVSYFREAEARAVGESFIKPLVPNPSDFHSIDPSQSDVVGRTLTAFTTSYARILGSKPDTGSLQPGTSHTFTAGRYVDQVLVALASREIGSIGTPTLSGPKGRVNIGSSGDNGCDQTFSGNPRHCTSFRRTYATFRAPHDPKTTGTYTLSLPSGVKLAEYGIILRYGLQAVLQPPAPVRMGEAVPLTATLQSKQGPVDDPAFLADLVATVRVGTQSVTLSHQGKGVFTGSLLPEKPGSFDAEVAFTNTWLDTRSKAPLVVEGFVPLTLNVPPIELGSWTAGRSGHEVCQPIDLSKSPGADKVPLACTARAPLTCTQSGGVWTLCADTPPCCGALPGPDGGAAFTIRGKHDHYAAGAATVPVLYEVSATGFLRCWWLEILILLGLMFSAFVLYGFFRPLSFDPAMSVKIAGREAALRRATSVILAEAPGGRRGWYRNARFGLTNDGTPTRKKGQAQFLLEAGPRRAAMIKKGGGLEMQNRRSRKWEPVPDGESVMQGATYRIGGMYLKFS